MNGGMALIRAQRGLLAKVAHDLGLTRAAVVKWDKVPAERVVDVEHSTGIPRERLRPDLYRKASTSALAAA
jgi:DNA-binding transcriptional regulator YdaS (Cro superfamily)